MPLNAAAAIEDGVVEIHTTFGSRDAAAACAARLVAERLAACVQVEGPLLSTYHWRAVVETGEEWRCTCKTTRARRDDCVAAIIDRHPYETPQVTILAVAATAAYAAWVRSSVEPP